MFCSECGTKNTNNDMFCSNCGAKLEQQATNTNSSVPKVHKPMSKKTKIILIIVAVIAVILGVGYKVLSDITSPKTVAKEFINAVNSKNSDKLYNYLELEGDKTFVTKKLFKDVLADSTLTTDIENYKITGVTYGEGKLTANVKFTYTSKKSSGDRTSSVTLAKEKGKKFLIFDNWKVSENLFTSSIVKELTLKVPKGSKVTYADIELADKYLDKDKSSDYDVYVLPQVFSTKTKVVAKLKNGMKLTKEITPSTYYKSYTIEFDKYSMSDDEKDEIVDAAKDIISGLYNNAIEGKKYADIKSDYAKASKKLENQYNDFLADIENASNKLTSITFNSGSLYDVDLNDDGDIEVEVKLNYDYKIEYTSLGETKTSEKSNYSYMTIVVAKDKDSYELVNIKELKTYFYR